MNSYDFLRDYICKENDTATHTAFDGGKWTVPNTDLERIYGEYIKKVNDGTRLCLTERIPKNDYFNFFIDLDFKYSYLVPEKNRILSTVVATLNETQYVFSMRNPYKFHVNFPNRHVTRPEAEEIVQKLTTRLNEELPFLCAKTGNSINWNEIIDTSVYRSGLRLLGSQKNQKAMDREWKEYLQLRDQLEWEDLECEWNPPFLSKNQIGKSYQVVNVNGEETITSSSSVTQFIKKEWMIMTSIRYIPEETYTILQENNFRSGKSEGGKSEGGKSQVKRKEKKKEKKGKSSPKEEIGDRPLEEEPGFNLSEDQIQIIKKWIGEKFCYQPHFIQNIKKFKDALRIDLNDTYCKHIGRNHKSNRQYIMIDKTEARKLCYDNDCKKNGSTETYQTHPDIIMMLQEKKIVSPPHIKIGDRINKTLLLDLFDPENSIFVQPQFTAYLNNFLAVVEESKPPIYIYRKSIESRWILRNYRDTADLLTVFRGKSNGDEPIDLNPFEIWRVNRTRRTYDNIIFDPSYIEDDDPSRSNLNLYRGFKARLLNDEEYSYQKVKPFLHHIKTVLAAGDKVSYDYIVNWFARMCQTPHIKGEIALVFTGEQGAGKNIIFDWIGKAIIGDTHYQCVNSLEALTGNFNSLNQNKIFTIGDELSNFGGSHVTSNRLKNLITQKDQRIELKGVDAFFIADYQNFVFLSNNNWPVRVEDSDRRYYVNRTANTYRGNRSYFKNLHDYFSEPDTADQVYTYLMKLDLSKFNVRDIPETAEKVAMRNFAKRAIDIYIESYVAQGLSDYLELGRTNEVRVLILFTPITILIITKIIFKILF